MAIIKSFTVPETGAEHPEAYWKVRHREEDSIVFAQIEIFANSSSAGKPEGRRLLPVYRMNIQIESEQATLGILGKASPVPAPTGTPDRERYNPSAQLYRYLKSLEQFSDAIDLK